MTPTIQRDHFRLILEHRAGYLYAQVEADRDSYEISRSYWEELANKVRELGVRSLLVKENIPDGFSMSEAFELASELPKMGFASVKIAFVDEFTEQDEINKFSEMVAVNRGLNVKVFNDMNEAERWLVRG